MSRPRQEKNKPAKPEPVSADQWEKFKEASKEVARAFRPYVLGYRALVRKLRAEGFRIRCSTIMAPIQLQGHLPSGEAFYFRCRGTGCSLCIAPRGDNPVTTPAWREEVSRWAWPDAGCLEAEEAEAVLRELLALYEGGAKPMSK